MRKTKLAEIMVLAGVIVFLLAGSLAAYETITCCKEMKKTADFVKEYKAEQDNLTKIIKVLE